MESISVAVIKKVETFPGVQLQEVDVTDYTDVEGFTFFTDCDNYPTATPCVLIHRANDQLAHCPIDKVAFIAINKDSDETADRSKAIEESLLQINIVMSLDFPLCLQSTAGTLRISAGTSEKRKCQ